MFNAGNNSIDIAVSGLYKVSAQLQVNNLNIASHNRVDMYVVIGGSEPGDNFFFNSQGVTTNPNDLVIGSGSLDFRLQAGDQLTLQLVVNGTVKSAGLGSNSHLAVQFVSL